MWLNAVATTGGKAFWNTEITNAFFIIQRNIVEGSRISGFISSLRASFKTTSKMFRILLNKPPSYRCIAETDTYEENKIQEYFAKLDELLPVISKIEAWEPFLVYFFEENCNFLNRNRNTSLTELAESQSGLFKPISPQINSNLNNNINEGAENAKNELKNNFQNNSLENVNQNLNSDVNNNNDNNDNKDNNNNNNNISTNGGDQTEGKQEKEEEKTREETNNNNNKDGDKDGDKDEIKKKDLCMVCKKNERNMVIVTCGHQILCGECAEVISACLLCSNPFSASEIIRVYRC